jgi:hypothetical protein
MSVPWPRTGLLVAALVTGVVASLAFALPAPARSEVSPVSFSGAAMGGQLITGSFTVDRFEVETPLDYSGLGARQPRPQLVAVGAVTGESSFLSPGGGAVTHVPFDNAPFVWVNLTVVATCGDAATVTFDQVGGSDYVGFGRAYGLPLWDPTVPIPVWNSDIHWGVEAADPLVPAGAPGLPCAIARAVSHGNLPVEATLLNALLR